MISLCSVARFAFATFYSMTRPPHRSTLFPYTTLFRSRSGAQALSAGARRHRGGRKGQGAGEAARRVRSEEHTSELQSRQYLVCRLLLEKKKSTTKAGSTLRSTCMNAGVKSSRPTGLQA